MINGLDFSSMVKDTPETLYNKMKATFDSLGDRESYNLIKDNYKLILSDIFEKKERKEVSGFIAYFTNTKFITCLTQVMYSETPDINTKRRLNKMCFDYVVLKTKDRDAYMSGLMMSLSKTVNRDVIPKLCSDIPVPEDLAATIALSRFSSEKEVVNVKRLNKVLMMQPLDLLSEQKIVDIYLALFDHVLPLFTGVMLDVVSPQNMTSDAEEIYGLITLSILDIMNELPISDIKKGLKLFDEDRKILYPDQPIRMNLKSCCEADFPRFIRALDELENEGVYIETK